MALLARGSSSMRRVARLDLFDRCELSPAGSAQKVVIRHRVPEEVRQSAGDREPCVGATVAPFEAEQEMW